ncbi:hypothetical protein Rin_00020030 [Candidatus Regiella insecticola 5.15]|uniref:Uncharacterized protein n=1 Tax=Candidatus Regiella insecticola 5.15 TaxID=1005043 RepID=G2H1Q9_9ENTR|nr:hypothetical protein [Candidatus Regiella insecticola]EGY28075.1 hypothetical protein Rin_00020030 [Candidatus Regiella insecticola 5.15]
MGEMVNVVNANHNKTRSHVQCYELNGKSNSEDAFPAVSPLSNQAPIQKNKASHLERSFELSEQKSKELGDIFTEVDRKPASELTNLEDHLTDITLKTQSVNAYVNSSVALAESAIHVLTEKKTSQRA